MWFLWCLSDDAIYTQGYVNPPSERLVFPTEKGQKGFENRVGLEKGWIGVKKREIYPMGDVIADKLGVKLLGEGVYKAFKTTGGRGFLLLVLFLVCMQLCA